MRRLTLLAVLALAACGGASEAPREELVTRADTICQNAAVPGIPVRTGTHLQARLASLALGQERREVARLRELGWDELDPALELFDRALLHLDAFVRLNGASAAERQRYSLLLDRWRGRAAALGLDLCNRFGFAY